MVLSFIECQDSLALKNYNTLLLHIQLFVTSVYFIFYLSPLLIFYLTALSV